MDSLSDDQLILQCREGRPEAFEALVRRHYPLVYQLAFRWFGRRQDAEDLAQDVFVKVAGRLDTFDRRSSFATWLYRVTLNAAKDRSRRQARRRDLESAYLQEQEQRAGAMPPGPEDRMTAERGLAAVERLPPKQKAAVLLVFGEGMRHKEAAAALGCSETTVSWRIYQARKKLKRLLAVGK